MNVSHLSFRAAGGAGMAALRAVKAVSSCGGKAKLHALWGWGRSDASDLINIIKPPSDVRSRTKRHIRRHLISRELSKVPLSSVAGEELEMFSSDQAPLADQLLELIPKDTDIIHLHWVAQLVDYLSFLPRASKRWPIVWTFHDLNPMLGGTHYREKLLPEPVLGTPFDKCCKGSQKIINRKREAFDQIDSSQLNLVAPSNWMASEMAACPTLARFNRSVIPNCVDPATFKAFDRRTARALHQVPEESFCIATVADSLIKERKGIRVLLQAFKYLIESSKLSRIHLLLIGPQPGDTSTIIPDEFLSTTNTLQSDSAVAVALAAADALVIPSLQDNLPNTVLEAMSCGLPVIGSNVGGIPDMVKHGATGLLFEPENPTELEQNIRYLIEHPEERQMMAKQARETVQENFSPRVQGEALMKLYTGLIS